MAWQPAVFSGVFLALSLGGIAYFLTIAADRENAAARTHSIHLAETALGTLREDIARRLVDYAWWDDMVAQAAASPPDLQWAEKNIGANLRKQFGYSGAYIVGQDLRTVFQSAEGDQPRDALEFLGEGGADLLRWMQGTPFEKAEAFTSFVRAKQGVFLFAAGPISPETPPPAGAPRAARPFLIFHRLLDEELLANLGHNFLLDGFRLVDVPEPGGVTLAGLGGRVAAGVVWQQWRPGDDMFGDLLWKLGAVAALLVLAAVLLGYMWARAAISANRAKSRFLAKMSHELLTPLNPITGFAHVMRDQMAGPLSEIYQEYAGHIHRSGLHLQAIVQDILDFSRIETGDLGLEEAAIDLPRLIRELPPILLPLRSGAAVREPMPLTLDIPADLPLLRADARRVRQVLINLLSNAAKFGCGREVILRAAVNGTGGIRVEVEDHGIGIAPEDMPKAFEPFTQVGRITDIYAGRVGAGIGLPIARELMELHGGSLDLESQVGRGTRAIMLFPADRTVCPETNGPAAA